MSRGIFITGSGTDVGKTHVSAQLLKKFAELGYGSTYMKPIETGCGESFIPGDGALAGIGTSHALSCASHVADIDLHSPYRFIPPCCPHLAARECGCEIKIDRIVSTYEKLNAVTNAAVTIVEGAGGVLVPINDKEFMSDVMLALKLPAILVTTPNLGTLNHTFLSLFALKQYGIPVVGIVINNAQNIERDIIYEDNIKTIRERMRPIPCLDCGYDSMANENSAFNSRYMDSGIWSMVSLTGAAEAAERKGKSEDEKLTEFCNEILQRV